MKDIIRQFFVVFSVAATLGANVLANALPLNGLTTGQISDRFEVYFVPAGYVFSIWGIIYLGLVSLAVFQLIPAQRENPRLRASGWWIVFGSVANIAWLFLWHYEQFPLTLVAMLGLLFTLIMTYLRLEVGRSEALLGERVAVHLPIRIYLGWITVATVANVTILLDFLNWDGFGITPEVWMGIVLAVVYLLAGLVIFTRRDAVYAFVLLWALAGIAVKQAHVSAVMVPVWITFGLISATLLLVYLLPRFRKGVEGFN